MERESQTLCLDSHRRFHPGEAQPLPADPRTDPTWLYSPTGQKGQEKPVQLILGHYTSDLPGAEAYAADISIAQDRERLVARFPDVSVLVNNAGIQVNTPIAESAPEDIEHELNVNFLAPVLLCRAFLPLLVRQPSAAIVKVSSGMALVPKEVAAMYCAS